jgi:hypothetical protein
MRRRLYRGSGRACPARGRGRTALGVKCAPGGTGRRAHGIPRFFQRLGLMGSDNALVTVPCHSTAGHAFAQRHASIACALEGPARIERTSSRRSRPPERAAPPGSFQSASMWRLQASDGFASCAPSSRSTEPMLAASAGTLDEYLRQLRSSGSSKVRAGACSKVSAGASSEPNRPDETPANRAPT